MERDLSRAPAALLRGTVGAVMVMVDVVVNPRPRLARRRSFFRRRPFWHRTCLGPFLEALGNRHHLGLPETHFSNASGHIEAGTALNAHRLKGDRLVEA